MLCATLRLPYESYAHLYIERPDAGGCGGGSIAEHATQRPKKARSDIDGTQMAHCCSRSDDSSRAATARRLGGSKPRFRRLVARVHVCVLVCNSAAARVRDGAPQVRATYVPCMQLAVDEPSGLLAYCVEAERATVVVPIVCVCIPWQAVEVRGGDGAHPVELPVPPGAW